MPLQRTALFLIFFALSLLWRTAALQAETGHSVIAVVLSDLRPVSFIDPKSKLPLGFAVDLMDTIAAKAGLQVNYLVVNNWKEAENALKTGAADLCPIMAVNDERKTYLNFTTYTETSGVTINIRSKSSTLTKLADLEGHPIGALRASQAYTLLKDEPKFHITQYDSYQVALLELLAGRIDAFIGPDNVVRNILLEADITDQIQILSPPLLEIKRALAVKKENQQLFKQLEKPTADFVVSPAYQMLYTKWYGSRPPFWTTPRVLTLFGLMGIVTLVCLAAWRYHLLYRYNQHISESERRFRGIFNQTLQLLALLDPQGHLTEVNQTALEISNVEEHELKGKLLWETPWFQHDQQLQTQIKNGVTEAAKGNLIQFLISLRSSKGSLHHIDFSIKPVFDECNQVCLLITEGRDISDRIEAENDLHEKTVQLEEEIGVRQKAEEELRLINESLEERISSSIAELRQKDDVLLHQSRLAAMGELLHNIAHQWRQPLNNIAVSIQAMQFLNKAGELSQEEMDRDIREVMAILLSLSSTIDDFRSFFVKDREKRSFVLQEITEKALNLIRPTFENLGITINVTAEADVRAIGYPTEYAQTLMNILYNSRDALLQKQVKESRIDICIRKEGGCSILTVLDNAGGIAPEILPHIFDPYFSTKGPTQGTGIGLYMAKTLIEHNMGGSITARNRGAGAEFTITL